MKKVFVIGILIVILAMTSVGVLASPTIPITDPWEATTTISNT